MGRNQNMNNAATSARTASQEKNFNSPDIGGDIPGLLPPIAPESKKPRNPFEVRKSPITGEESSPVKRPTSEEQKVIDTKLGVKDESGKKLTPTFRNSRRRKQDVMANRRKKAKDIPSPTQQELDEYKKRNTPQEPAERPEKDPFEMSTPYGKESTKPPQPKKASKIKEDPLYRSTGKKSASAASTLGRGNKPLAAGGRRRRRR